MGDYVRRVRLLVAVGATGLLTLIAAWPSQGAVTEPLPLYLARDAGSLSAGPAETRLVMLGDGPRLSTHLLAEREDPAALEVIDDVGRVVVLKPDGGVADTSTTVDPAAVKVWLKESFAVRARLVDRHVITDPRDKECWGAEQTALGRLNLPTHDAKRELTLAETYAEADRRIAAMHQPANQIPFRCVTGVPSHKAGYLHNLWHRITGS